MIVNSTAGLVAIVAVLLSPSYLAGQKPKIAPQNAPAKNKWMPPRLPWKHPDLRGVWSLATATRLERPPNLAEKEFLTEEEADQFERQAVEQIRKFAGIEAELSGELNEVWLTSGKVVESRRTSLIVDPPNGRYPPLTQEAKALADSRLDATRRNRVDSPEDRPLAERCIVYGAGPPMLPASGKNPYIQIFQTRTHVVILIETIHDARIIPLDGRPHLPPNIRQWLGDSRGRWEGTTLVVETTNFTDKSEFRGFGGFFRVIGDALRVVERFTRTDANTIRYYFTVNDPGTWTRPWSAEMPMRKTDGPIYEYACHEGNYSMALILSGARSQEKTLKNDVK